MVWLDDWADRLTLTIDHERIDDPQTDFQAVITLSSGSGRTNFDSTGVFTALTTSGSSYDNRKKIAVTDSNNNRLYVEIEQWDHDNQLACLWTKVPTVATGTDTILYLYYDIDQPDNNLYVADTGTAVATNVWPSEFVCTYHINTLPSTSAYMLDSTQTFDITTVGTFTDGNLVSANTGLGYNFDGGNDGLDHAYNSAFLIQTFTLSVMFKSDSISTNQTLINRDRGNSDVSSYNCNYEIRINASKIWFRFENSSGSDFGLTSNQTLSSDTWYHVVCTFNDTTNYAAIYINGYLDKSTTTTIVPNTNCQQPLRIGRYYSNTTGYILHFDGIMAEAELISEDKSAAWVKAQYFSMFDDLITFAPTPVFTASGTVTVDGLLTDDIPVRLYRRSTGQLVGETTTVSGGRFEIGTPHNELHYAMAMHTSSGTNAVIYDWIAP